MPYVGEDCNCELARVFERFRDKMLNGSKPLTTLQPWAGSLPAGS